MSNQQQMPVAYNNGWQVNYSTIGESMGHFFMNEDDADIWFVPLLNAANPPKKFPANKLILKARSPVFYAQFRFDELKKKQFDKKENEENERASNAHDESKKPIVELSPADGNNKGETIELADVEPKAFEQFLRFCYTDSVEINGENAASILYIANRYAVKPLIGQTIKFLKVNTNVENVFEMLQFATQFNFEGIEDVEKAALEIIRSKTEEVVKTEAFLGIDSETLQRIFNQESLAIKEIALFKALIRWGKRQQENAENKEKSLRELITPALFHIQFWEMSIWTIGCYVVPTLVLTKDEAFYIFDRLSTKDNFFEWMFPFTTIGKLRGGQFLTLEIENVREFVERETSSMYSESVSISGFSFEISAQIGNLTKDNDTRKHLGFYLYCKDSQPWDVSKEWNCEAAYQLILVAKAPNQEDEIHMFTRRFEAIGDNSDSWGSSRFISIEDLLDPAKGWMENDSVTLKAKVQVLDRGDFDDAKNEADETEDDDDSTEEQSKQ